jgi:hypothetical protein
MWWTKLRPRSAEAGITYIPVVCVLREVAILKTARAQRGRLKFPTF